eukprot:6609550-Pyramimonas_sp.AAC.1
MRHQEAPKRRRNRLREAPEGLPTTPHHVYKRPHTHNPDTVAGWPKASRITPTSTHALKIPIRPRM